MTESAPRDLSRRSANARKRLSRRPSRLGTVAGAAVKPDRVREEDAGFPGLLAEVWRKAGRAADTRAALDVLLTLDGRVPAEVQLGGLRSADAAALRIVAGLGRAEQHTGADEDADAAADGRGAFLGELGLTTSGRVVVRVPSRPPLAKQHKLVSGVLRLSWTEQHLADFQRELAAAEQRFADAAADSRRWLERQGPEGRDALLAQLTEAAQRTAPFMLYIEDNQYTNFRDTNNVTGKTLWPGHPDCALSSLVGMPLQLWSDHDAIMIVGIALLIRSAGYGRIEEANGSQLTLDNVGQLLERTRRTYNGALGAERIPAAPSEGVEDLMALAEALGAHRPEVAGSVQLYREIHGALIHKVEKAAAPYGERATALDRQVTERLLGALPLTGGSLDELRPAPGTDPLWLARPHGAFDTGLEAVVHEAVAATTDALDADFTMSRGLRSLPALVRALRAEDWDGITKWGITDFFCCVVPSADAARHFGGSISSVADTAWAMSSRMQYNSWHFIAGNLPRTDAVLGRDHFVPPVIPDIAHFSDQHHHGHVNNMVRFTIRSPHAVEVLGRRFNGFMDMRVLRCAGTPFTEQEMLAVHKVSGFIARSTSQAAALAEQGEQAEVTSFDSEWHWRSVTGTPVEAAGAGRPRLRVA
ncbi:hypothetical protein [Kitasatospora cineracea]|uniref:Uncharacterized protein n=1 Tax=Kitasatospora cineracea TaxID=88074 RepID=A0A8G1UAR3_9ACTN|nr:hypothetical protein [Kitasatospora cineracea]ROR34066.1 hypothetical protein EDD39_7627 [Kitasatospora cineracea]